MNMTESDFADMAPRTFFLKLLGFSEMHTHRFRASWEQTRWETWHLVNIHLKQEDKIKDPRMLINFDWEPKLEARIPKRADIERSLRRFGEDPAKFKGLNRFK